MRTAILLATVTTTLAILAGCSEPEPCTDLAAVSVSILVEKDGAPVPDAVVEFSVDGGAFEPCQDWVDRWACGIEVAGEILVRVSAPGLTTVERGYSVAEDSCHVATIEDMVELTSDVSCTEELRPSVQLTVTDGVDAIAGATARWRPVTPHDESWEDCTSGGDDLFCGSEWTGEMEIEASAAGFETHTTTVAISADDCHVITQERELVLTAL